MKRSLQKQILAAVAGAALASGAAEAKTYTIKAGPDSAKQFKDALAHLQPGDRVRLGAGTFDFDTGVSLNQAAVEVRGEGPGKTILSFTQAKGPGLTVGGYDVTLRDFAVKGADHSGILVQGVEFLAMKNLAVSGAADGCAMHFSFSKKVQADVLALGDSKYSGLCIDDSRELSLKNLTTTGSAAGVYLRDSSYVDLINLVSTGNGVGVIVAGSPGMRSEEPSFIRLVAPKVEQNNGAGWNLHDAAPVQSGVGVAIFAARDVAIEGGTIGGHNTTNIYIGASASKVEVEGFNALPGRIGVHNVTFGPAGALPQGAFAKTPAAALKGADVVWDGVTAYVAAGRPKTEPVLIDVRGGKSADGGAPRTRSLGLAAAGQPLEDGLAEERIPPVSPFAPPPPVVIR